MHCLTITISSAPLPLLSMTTPYFLCHLQVSLYKQYKRIAEISGKKEKGEKGKLRRNAIQNGQCTKKIPGKPSERGRQDDIEREVIQSASCTLHKQQQHPSASLSFLPLSFSFLFSTSIQCVSLPRAHQDGPTQFARKMSFGELHASPKIKGHTHTHVHTGSPTHTLRASQ